MSRISEILGDNFEAEPSGYFNFEKAEAAINAYIATDIIGYDELLQPMPEHSQLDNVKLSVRNQLRAEQRKRAGL